MTVKPRQSVKLTDPQTAFLNAEATSLGITIAELIRRIIDERRVRPAPRWHERADHAIRKQAMLEVARWLEADGLLREAEEIRTECNKVPNP